MFAADVRVFGDDGAVKLFAPVGCVRGVGRVVRLSAKTPLSFRSGNFSEVLLMKWCRDNQGFEIP